MAYESKVYIVDVHRHGNGFIYAEKIAEVNLACMGYTNGWRELFDKEIDYELYKDDGNTLFFKDRYDEHMKSCPIDRVIAWLEKEMEHSDYRRLPVLYGLLKGFAAEKWGNNLEVVHYGY